MSIVFHLTNCPAPPLLCIKISVCHLKASVLQDASLNLLVSPVVPCSLTCTDTVWQTCEWIKTHSHRHTCGWYSDSKCAQRFNLSHSLTHTHARTHIHICADMYTHTTTSLSLVAGLDLAATHRFRLCVALTSKCAFVPEFIAWCAYKTLVFPWFEKKAFDQNSPDVKYERVLCLVVDLPLILFNCKYEA